MALPLHASWTLLADALPERLQPAGEPSAAFRLPGADALGEFAELLGYAPDEPDPCAGSAPEGVSFALPALIPEDVPGKVVLTREIDFGQLSGNRAFLSFDMLCGQGEAALESLPPRFCGDGMPQGERIALSAAFQGGPLTLDVTAALHAHKRCRLTLRFDAPRPAGVCGPVILRTVTAAMLKHAVLKPQSSERLLTLCAEIAAIQTGDYVLRAQLCPAEPSEVLQTAPAAHEVSFHLDAGNTKTVHLSMEAACGRFVPGKVYAAPALKLWLSRQFFPGKSRVPCDGMTLLCGMPGEAPQSFLPLAAADCLQPPEALTKQLLDLHVPAVSLPCAAPDILYRHLTRAGIGVRQTAPKEAHEQLCRYPCVTLDDALSTRAFEESEPVLSAWRLCGLVTYPRAAAPDLTAADMLREAAGREIDPAAPDVQEVLAWLRAFSIRLRAEAIRQGRLHGAYCAPGERHEPDAMQALQTALAPLHLSALPLCGAWWTLSHFSASLHAFIPEGAYERGAALRAEAVLEDAQGKTLARAEFSCPAKGGPLGLIEAQLPDTPGVLELITRLYADGELIEESTMPVYIGERGPLEAAF